MAGYSFSEKQIRLFAAIVPEPGIIECMSPFINRLKTEPWAKHVRWVRPKNIHLTIRFLGNTNTDRYHCLVDTLTRSLGAVTEFDISLSKVLHLPSPAKTRVIAAGVIPSPRLNSLAACVEAVARECGFEPEKKRFLANFTVGRCKNLDLRKLKPTLDFKGINVPVNGVNLVKSTLSPTGSVYGSMDRIALKPISE